MNELRFVFPLPCAIAPASSRPAELGFIVNLLFWRTEESRRSPSKIELRKKISETCSLGVHAIEFQDQLSRARAEIRQRLFVDILSRKGRMMGASLAREKLP